MKLPNLKKILTVFVAAIVVATSAAPAANAIAPGDEYVALGDSYSSGIGADVYKSPIGINLGNINLSAYEAGTATSDNKCFRSKHAYAKQLASALNLTLKFKACSGATIPQIEEGLYNEGPQIDALTPATKLVTLTAGGNDAGFINAVQCFITKFDCKASDPVIATFNATVANELPGRYDSLIAKIKARAPQAQVILSGYATTLPNKIFQDPYLSTAERDLIKNMVTSLNAQASQAAARNSITYVEPFAPGSPFLRSDASAGNIFKPSATWALRAEVDFPSFGSSYHPTRKGHDYYTQVILPVVQ